MSKTTQPLASVLVTLLFCGQGFGFNILPDTVNLLDETPGHSPFVDFIIHQDNDSLILDSISVTNRQVYSEEVELSFYLRSTDTPSPSINRYYLIYCDADTCHLSSDNPDYDDLRAAIPPNITVQLGVSWFDACCSTEPTAKRAISAAVGDTLRATVVFHSGDQKDSVLFLAIQHHTSGTTIIPFHEKNQRHIPVDYFDLQGRKVSDPGIHRVVMPAPVR